MNTLPNFETLLAIGEKIRNQDNRATSHPIFCVQEKKRDIGFDANYSEGQTVWINMQSGDYEEVEPDTEGAEEFGYKDRWETVMMSFTESACKEYIENNGHRFKGELQIYAESLYRCSEMIAIREFLIALKP